MVYRRQYIRHYIQIEIELNIAIFTRLFQMKGQDEELSLLKTIVVKNLLFRHPRPSSGTYELLSNSKL